VRVTAAAPAFFLHRKLEQIPTAAAAAAALIAFISFIARRETVCARAHPHLTPFDQIHADHSGGGGGTTHWFVSCFARVRLSSLFMMNQKWLCFRYNVFCALRF